MNTYNILLQNQQKYASKPALIFNNTTYTFSDLFTQVVKLSNVLKHLDVKKSDKVAICLPNCAEYAFSYLSCFCIGATVVPLDYMLKNDELISCLSHSEAKVLIVQPKNDICLNTIRSKVPSLEKIIILSDNIDENVEGIFLYKDLMMEASQEFSSVDIYDTDPALIMYTSGTTGRPKGILLNYKHLEGSPRAMEYFVDLSDRDIKLAAIPLSHIAGLIYIQNCILFKITLIIMGRFNPYEFLRIVDQYKVTCFHIVPAMYIALLSLKQIDKFDLSSLRWVVVFGAPSSPDIMQRFSKYCPNAKLLNGWGMTETCPPNTVTPFDSNNIKSVGRPSPICKIKIVDEEDKEVPPQEIGEICIQGWIVMDSYYKDPELTSKLKKNGWLYTGDLGRFDQEGFLYIVGRKKEMIKVGGQIVYAPEVESVFHKHEAVEEVAVIGIKDALRGEAIKAFVTLKDGVNILPEELRYFIREHLAHFKVPQAIEIKDFLPKNRIGKIDKEALKNSNGN